MKLPDLLPALPQRRQHVIGKVLGLAAGHAAASANHVGRAECLLAALLATFHDVDELVRVPWQGNPAERFQRRDMVHMPGNGECVPQVRLVGVGLAPVDAQPVGHRV